MDLTSSTKTVTLEATITRADGKVEPQGIVAYWHRNPLKRLQYRFLKRVKGKVICA